MPSTDEVREPTPEEALDALYQLTRKVTGLNADGHDAMRQARDIVARALAQSPTAG